MQTAFRATLVIGAIWFVSGAAAQDAEPPKKPAEPPAGQAPSEEEMAWIRAAVPGPHHERLEYMIGEWDTVVTMTEENGAEVRSKGRATNTWILGKRYVRNEYRGDFMGQPFEGLGYTGYDNINKRYVSSWMDTMSTGIMYEEGQFDETARQFVMLGAFEAPDGTKMRSRSTIRVIGKDRHTITFEHASAGDEDYTKVMEVEYTRVRASTRSDKPE